MIVVYYLNIGVTTSQCSFMALDWGADRGAVLCTPAVSSSCSLTPLNRRKKRSVELRNEKNLKTELPVCSGLGLVCGLHSSGNGAEKPRSKIK